MGKQVLPQFSPRLALPAQVPTGLFISFVVHGVPIVQNPGPNDSQVLEHSSDAVLQQ